MRFSVTVCCMLSKFIPDILVIGYSSCQQKNLDSELKLELEFICEFFILGPMTLLFKAIFLSFLYLRCLLGSWTLSSILCQDLSSYSSSSTRVTILDSSPYLCFCLSCTFHIYAISTHEWQFHVPMYFLWVWAQTRVWVFRLGRDSMLLFIAGFS